MPNTVPSPSCPLCAAPIEDQLHFFFGCSQKREVWTNILSRHLPTWTVPLRKKRARFWAWFTVNRAHYTNYIYGILNISTLLEMYSDFLIHR
ncbi:hypothetical protein CLU79DRAFT_288310 [Phycomyces nitens]|nr:hypothetical protein CLU79DRAFT_288310 [Phycomyces nitens]